MPSLKHGQNLVDLTTSDDEVQPAKRPRVGDPRLDGVRPTRPLDPVKRESQRGAPSTPSRNFRPPAAAENSAERDATGVEDDGPKLYKSFDTKIESTIDYPGSLVVGQRVFCKREPWNKYDPNAIRVTDARWVGIGYLTREVAGRLAGHLDSHSIYLQGSISGPRDEFDCPIKLSVYGKVKQPRRPTALPSTARSSPLSGDNTAKAQKSSQAISEIRRKLKEEHVRTVVKQERPHGKHSGVIQQPIGDESPASASKRVKVESSAANGVKDEAEALNKIKHEAEAIMANEILNRLGGSINQRYPGALTANRDEVGLEAMPRALQPTALSTKLLPYQLQGLAWLISQEQPVIPPVGSGGNLQFWSRNADGTFFNMATAVTFPDPPELVSGGILADEPGIGKTIQMIALIMRNTRRKTLIVAPTGVMSNWSKQLEDHVDPKYRPRILVYHGREWANPSHAFAQVAEPFDIVITSYGKLKADWAVAPRASLWSLRWGRVILDEGHIIRSGRSLVFKAVCELRARNRWLLTGTPIVNDLGDLGSMLRFLGMSGGLALPKVFNRVVARPFARQEYGSQELVHQIMFDLCLRRKHDMPFVNIKLPPRTDMIVPITFRPEEKERYKVLLEAANICLSEFQASQKRGGGVGYFHVLESLTRLRQVCNHWAICRQRYEDLVRHLREKVAEGGEDPGQNEQLMQALQQVLQIAIDSEDTCSICLEVANRPVITHCMHVFCRSCIERALAVSQTCPLCRQPLNVDGLVEPPVVRPVVEVEPDDSTSSKTDALEKVLGEMLQGHGNKAIVFSQWTSFLDVVQARLDSLGPAFKYTRMDGSMNVRQRDRAIAALEQDPGTRIMLASTKACNEGLNLMAANVAVLCDSWWAPAVEDQAVARIHRLGQTRSTTVYRLIMEDSIEQRVLQVQDHKRQLIRRAFRDEAEGELGLLARRANREEELRMIRQLIS